MKRVLFGCLGTTDPVRGEHDGPMLHILRHYRPEIALLIISSEIKELDDKDNRVEKTRERIVAHWEGYCPTFQCVYVDTWDAHDMDALDQPLHDAMEKFSAAHPDAEILVNLTSGTPQMQIILSLPRKFPRGREKFSYFLSDFSVQKDCNCNRAT